MMSSNLTFGSRADSSRLAVIFQFLARLVQVSIRACVTLPKTSIFNPLRDSRHIALVVMRLWRCAGTVPLWGEQEDYVASQTSNRLNGTRS